MRETGAGDHHAVADRPIAICSLHVQSNFLSAFGGCGVQIRPGVGALLAMDINHALPDPDRLVAELGELWVGFSSVQDDLELGLIGLRLSSDFQPPLADHNMLGFEHALVASNTLSFKYKPAFHGYRLQLAAGLNRHARHVYKQILSRRHVERIAITRREILPPARLVTKLA